MTTTGKERRCDLAVIGAGFAGLACARAAAGRGLKTIVLERKTDVGAGLRTTGLLVKEVADEWDVPRRLTWKIHGVRLYGPSLGHVDLASPGYYFLATDTAMLMRWWAREAEAAGARVMRGAGYRGCEERGTRDCAEPPSRLGLRLRGHDVECRYLVGADGARSRVAAEFGLASPSRFLMGSEVEMVGVRSIDADRLHVFLDSKLTPGYIGWVVPGMGVTQVGLAAAGGRRPQLRPFMEKLSKLFDFRGARIVGKRSGPMPVGGPLRRIGVPGVMLVGDAAGMVSPLTAGGIHTAIHFGRAAGLAVCDHLLDGGADPVGVVRSQVPLYVFKRVLRAAIDVNPPNWVYDAAMGSAVMRRLAQTVFYHGRGFFTWRAWRDLVMGMDAGEAPLRGSR